MTLRNLKPLSIAVAGLMSTILVNGAYSDGLQSRGSPARLYKVGALPSEANAVGDWIGVWYGPNTAGRFDLSLQRASSGKFVGNISVSTDGGNTSEFAVDLGEVSVEGETVTAIFVTPGQNPDVVTLTGSLGQKVGTGDWTSRKKTDPATHVAERGTWQIQKHEAT